MLVNSDGDAVLCDFGLSRIRHEHTRTLTISQSGGRERFLAPELTTGDLFRTTEASDVYSWVMTIYELGTGQPPFALGPNILGPYQLVPAVQRGIRPDKTPPFLGMDAIPFDRLWELMTTMWQHEPSSRPASNDVYEWLENNFPPVVIASTPSAPPSPTTTITPPTTSDDDDFGFSSLTLTARSVSRAGSRRGRSITQSVSSSFIALLNILES